VNYTTTSSQIALVDARRFVGRQIGFPLEYDGSNEATRDLTGDQLVALTRALLDYIKNNPSRFSSEQVTTAKVESPRFQNFDAAEAEANSVTLFGELANEAEKVIGEPLAAIGQGVSTSVKLAGNLIPFLMIGALVIFALPYLRRANASVS